MPPEAAALLEDIREAAQFIADDTAGATLVSYRQDRRLRQLAERNFEIIGEAMRQLSDLDPVLAARITGRREIIALRNRLIHGYRRIDHDRVWRIVAESLPLLQQEVGELLTGMVDEAESMEPS